MAADHGRLDMKEKVRNLGPKSAQMLQRVLLMRLEDEERGRAF